MTSINKLVRPFLKWAGGKRQLIPIIQSHLPKNFHTYYEPFIGGGALFFALQPERAVISDSNAELINCYQVIRDFLDELIDDLSIHHQNLKEHKNPEDYYYHIRYWDRDEDYKFKTPVARASRIIFLNKTCYNGLFRVNSQGFFNVPFGRYKNPNILDTSVLKAVNKYLNQNQINISISDFQQTVKDAKKGDFIYFDPPYDPVSDTASFTGYDVNKFNRDEQQRLKETYDDLHQRGCYILLSNAHTEFILTLYKQYNPIKISAMRAINSNAHKRGKVDEVLVKNYE